MKKGVIFNILIVLFAAVFIFSGYNVVKILMEDSKTKNLYTELQSEYVTPVEPPSATTDTSTKEVLEPAISVDFSALLNKNKDVVGWLYLPDTAINYPVVQAEDNDKYLRRDLNGKKLSAGTLFADYRNDKVNADPNYIVYGHNMKNGTMFRTLIEYKEQKFYDENPVIYYFTPEKNYKIELVAGVIIPSNDDIYNLSLDRASMFEFISKSVERSTFKTNTIISEEDNFITLSTCSYEYEDARFAVIGKITEEESKE